MQSDDENTAAVAVFLSSAADELIKLEDHIRDRPGYEWPAEMARPFTPAQARAVLAWLGSRLMAGKWGA
jgi:hypothetical protein